MKKAAREALDAYYREGESWADDRLAALRGSRRIAWIVATAAAIVAVFEAVALIFLAPLKTVVPYTLMVDRHTGYVQALRPLDAEMLTPDAALTQSFVVQYVIARESFDINDIQNAYRKVTLWSTQGARTDYVAAMQASNPRSPLLRYPRTTVVETRVKSVSPLGGHSVLVRFETQRRDAGGQLAPAQAWVTVMSYRFSSTAQSTEDRFVNPLGFQVDHYRRSAEALTTPDPAAPPSQPPAQPTALAPGEAAPGYAPPGYAAPGYATPGYVTPRPAPSRQAAPRPNATPTIEVTL